MGRLLFPVLAAVVTILFVFYRSYQPPACYRCLTMDEGVSILKQRGLFAPATSGKASPNSQSGTKTCPRLVVRDDSATTRGQEEDNVKSGFFVGDYPKGTDANMKGKVTGFRLKATQPIADTNLHHFGANFTDCSNLVNYVIVNVGEYKGGSEQFAPSKNLMVNTSIVGPSPGTRSYEFHAPGYQAGWPETCGSGQNEKKAFPDSLNLNEIGNVTVSFTSWLNADQRGTYGTKGTNVTTAFASVTGGNAVVHVYFSNTTDVHSNPYLGSCALNQSDTLQQCQVNIPDMYKPDGCYTSSIQYVLQPNDTAPGTVVYFDSITMQGRATVPLRTDALYSNTKQVVQTAYEDYWFRYPELLNVTVADPNGAITASDDTSCMVTYSQSRHDYYIDQLVQTFVMYEDGNIRLTPYPKQGWLQIPFGASFIFGRSADYTNARPVEPVKNVHVITSTKSRFEANVTYTANTLDFPDLPPADYTVHFDLTSDEESTTLTVTGLEAYAVYNTSLGIFRSMTTTQPPVYPGMNDIDTAIAYDRLPDTVTGNFHFPSPGSDLEADVISFVRLCPSAHNTDAPEFTAELLCE